MSISHWEVFKMNRKFRIAYIMVTALTAFTMMTTANDFGFFRTIPVETPERGIIRMSNTSHISNFIANSVLESRYGVKDPRIFGSVTEIELGVTDYLNFNGSLPYYADMFKQGSRSGKKTGAGDVVLGFRLAKSLGNKEFRGLSFGGRVRIPEQLGYGAEPLGLRTFSYGKVAYSIEASSGFRVKMADCNISVAMIRFPNAANVDSAFTSDTFYNTGFGYMGVGRPDATGLAEGLFQNQLHISAGTSFTVNPWFAGILEFNSTRFLKTPKRETIISLTPGFRLGNSNGFNLSAGLEYALNGPIPDKTFMFRFRVPTLSASDIKQILTRKSTGPEIRSKNSLVAVNHFTKQDMSYLYSDDLKKTLYQNMNERGVMSLVPEGKVKQAFVQESLAAAPDKPQELGVRLGANYLINAEIANYSVTRGSSLKIPFLISFPETNFSISVIASVTDLSTGERHTLGTITSNYIVSRGVIFFPTSPSSDIEFISVLERRDCEKELIDRWVEKFNSALMENIDIFGWEPKQTGLVESSAFSG